MSNPSLSEIKIGESSKDPSEDRVKDLSNTSVPTPFKVEYKALVHDQRTAEAKVHRVLGKFRVSPNREFFNCSKMFAVNEIRRCVTLEKEYIYFDDIAASRAKKEKQAAAQRAKKLAEEKQAAVQKAKRLAEEKQAGIIREKRREFWGRFYDNIWMWFFVSAFLFTILGLAYEAYEFKISPRNKMLLVFLGCLFTFLLLKEIYNLVLRINKNRNPD
jgi:hypothetical protein